MSNTFATPDPFEDFIELLETQKRGHKSKCTAFTLGFAVSLVLAVAVGVPLALNAAGLLPETMVSDRLASVLSTLIGPMLGFAMLFFTAWMGTESCLTALDASLFAARRRNQHLLEKLFDRVECGGKKGGVLDALQTIVGN
jgi:hypothetical protein